MIIRSKRIYTEDGLVDGWLRIENGVIVEIGQGDNENAIDYGDKRIIPGFFDTHSHGTQGYALWSEGDTFDLTPQLKGYLKGVASEGVTLVFPTLFGATGAGPAALGAVRSVAAEVGKKQDGATVAGVHFEGPYLNRVGEKGTRTEPAKIDLDFMRELIQVADGKLRLMGLAPELPLAEELTALLLENDITVAFTHSDSDSGQAFAAFDRGVSVSTHLCNVMTGMHHRNVGGLGASILDDRVYCELICDGLHVSNDMIKIILRAKPNHQIMVISDCTGYSGAPSGTYEAFLGRGGKVIVDDEGFVREPAGRLRGSSKPILNGLWNLVENIGLDIDQALKLCSLNACEKYGFADRKGSLKVGKDADFVVISDDYLALETFVGGKKVFDRATEGGKIFNQRMLESLESRP